VPPSVTLPPILREAAHFPGDVLFVHPYCCILKNHITHVIPRVHFPIPVFVCLFSIFPPVSLFVIAVVLTHTPVGYSPKLWKDQSCITGYVSKLVRLQSSSTRLNNNVFPKHLLEHSKTFHSQRLAATHRDLLRHTLTWELPGADAVACLNNNQLSAMLNIISECFNNDVQY